MVQIGLFSSHLPYIVLVLSYITCWGYYSLNQKDLNEDQEVQQIYNELQSGSLDQENAWHYTDRLSDDSAICSYPLDEKDKFAFISHAIVRYVFYDSVLRNYDLIFCLFSRPPPNFV